MESNPNFKHIHHLANIEVYLCNERISIIKEIFMKSQPLRSRDFLFLSHAILKYNFFRFSLFICSFEDWWIQFANCLPITILKSFIIVIPGPTSRSKHVTNGRISCSVLPIKHERPKQKFYVKLLIKKTSPTLFSNSIYISCITFFLKKKKAFLGPNPFTYGS